MTILAAIVSSAASAQGMMDHVDFSSPKMSAADMTRAEVEALIAQGKPVDLADRSLNGLDLSGLDLTGADLRWARLNRAKLAGTRLDEARLELAWAIEADLSGASLKGANLFQAQLLRANLDGADLTLFTTDDKVTRRDFIHLPQSGYAQLLKHLTGSMGNRFLRHTAFDILEDGRIEQTFFRQTKDFLVTDAAEYRFHINTATRGYEMTAKREQLAADTGAFVTTLVQSLQGFLSRSAYDTDPCTIALTERATHLPGLESKLRAAGFSRLLRLPRGTAACGAARIGASRLSVPADLADVPVETAVPLADTRRLVSTQWDARLLKNRDAGARLAPTHAILGGIGHALARHPRFTIGLAELGADLPLPDGFSAASDCAVPLLHEGGRLWFVDTTPGRAANGADHPAGRTPVESGDRLTIRCGSVSAEVLFAHCPVANGARLD